MPERRGAMSVVHVQIGYWCETMSRDVHVAMTLEQFRLFISQIHSFQDRLLAVNDSDDSEEV